MIDLPTWTAPGAAAVNSLAARLPLTFTCAGHAVAVGPTIAAMTVPGDWLRLTARVAGRVFNVSLDHTLLPAQALAQWPDIVAVGAPPPLRDLLLDLLLADVAQDIAAWCGERPDWTTGEDAGATPAAMVVTDAAAPDRILATIGTDDAGLAWLAARCAGLPVRRARLDTLPILFDLLVDRIGMRRDEIAALGRGDVVLLDRHPVDDAGAVSAILFAPGFPGARARVEGGRITIQSVLGTMSNDPPASDPVAAPSAAPSTNEVSPAPSIDGIPLDVNCDIGRVSLTLGRIGELAEGQVIDLGLDVTSRVTLRVNGQAIATGELVRVAERTGVRITEVLLSRPR